MSDYNLNIPCGTAILRGTIRGKQGGGSALLLLHGRNGDHTDWQLQLEGLSDELTVLAVDARGMGRSTAGTEPYTMERLVDDCIAILDACDIDRAVIMGLSMGGGIAQEVALRFRSRVAGLILVSTSSEFSSQTRSRFIQEAEEIEATGIISDDLIERMASKWYTETFLEEHGSELVEVRAKMARTDPQIYALRCRINAERNLTDSLSQIEVPVLYVGGAADPAGAEANARAFSSALPQTQIAILPDVSHCLQREAPELLNELVREFFRKEREHFKHSPPA